MTDWWKQNAKWDSAGNEMVDALARVSPQYVDRLTLKKGLANTTYQFRKLEQGALVRKCVQVRCCLARKMG
jgi:hypothetical protein